MYVHVYPSYTRKPLSHISLEYPSVTILYANLLPIGVPSIISPYAVQNMGIGEFLYV